MNGIVITGIVGIVSGVILGGVAGWFASKKNLFLKVQNLANDLEHRAYEAKRQGLKMMEVEANDLKAKLDKMMGGD